MPGLRLDGRVAIITGGASGQGLAAVELFLEEGARVAAFDMNEKGLQDLVAKHSEVLPVTVNLTDPEAVSAAIEQVVEKFGTLDVVYNNAGIITRKPGEWDITQDGLLADISVDEFDKNLSVNLRSQFLVNKYAIPHMSASGGGSIINVSSTAGPQTGTGNHAYSTAKAGVIGLTHSIAFSYGKQGIRANTICPGMVETPIVDHLTSNQEFVDHWAKAHPIGRFAKPREMATVGLFLASDDASYINGATIVADGGWTIRGS